MIQFIAKYKIEIITAILGGIGGYAYWFYIGCSTGACPITANWHTSVIYGVIMGFLVGQMITDYTKKKQQTEQ